MAQLEEVQKPRGKRHQAGAGPSDLQPRGKEIRKEVLGHEFCFRRSRGHPEREEPFHPCSLARGKKGGVRTRMDFLEFRSSLAVVELCEK